MSRASPKLPPVVSASGAYYAAHAFVVVAGLISMPIMTRLLSKAEYGLLGLVYATASIFALVGGMGFGEAAVRLYGEQRQRGPAALRNLCSTLVGGAFAAGSLVGLALAAVAGWLGGAGSSPYVDCLPLVAVLVVIRAVSGVIYQIFRAQERAGAHALTQVCVRYGTTVVAIAGLLLFRRNAATVMVAALLVESVAVAVRLADLWRRGLISMPERAGGLLRTAVAYGLPLAVAGSARFLLDYADRFLIERLLGLDAVATYGVAYDIAAKLGETFSTPIQLAAVPILFRLWVAEGQEATSRFASDVLTYAIAIAIPIATLYLIYCETIIVLLASDKYRNAAELTPYLLPGVLLSSLNFVVTAGLTVQKRTTVLALTVCGAALLNVALNLVLMPRWQLVGAAIATTTAYAVLVVASHFLAGAVVQLRLGYGVLLKAAIATALSVLLLQFLALTAPSGAVGVALGLLVGTSTAAAIFAGLDPRLRQLAIGQIPRSRR